MRKWVLPVAAAAALVFVAADATPAKAQIIIQSGYLSPGYYGGYPPGYGGYPGYGAYPMYSSGYSTFGTSRGYSNYGGYQPYYGGYSTTRYYGGRSYYGGRVYGGRRR